MSIYTDIYELKIELVNLFTWGRGMRYRHKSQRTEKIIFWSWFLGTMIELGHLSWTLLWPAYHNASSSWAWRKRRTTFKATAEQACLNWSVTWWGTVMAGKQKGEELPNTSSSHITLPCRKRWTARAKWATVRDRTAQWLSAKLSWSAHGAKSLAQNC